jgi:hypothetical protein
VKAEVSLAVAQMKCVVPSPAAGSLDFGDVDLAHFHHRREGAFGFGAAGVEGVRQHARPDLPEDSPAVFAPAAPLGFAAVADDGIPIAGPVRRWTVARRFMSNHAALICIVRGS